ncbi:MAG: nucleoside deaminase [Nitrospirae bacterium]|nr:nucleoside deaminase [Nitrospirota bacterium]
MLRILNDKDEFFMSIALQEALKAADAGEVPVGAVVVSGSGEVVSRAYNTKERSQDPTAHAEMAAIREASALLGSWRLEGCSLYVTLEPCIMCSGAIINSRIMRIIYGCTDPKGGAVESLYGILDDGRLNHRVGVTGGVLRESCSNVLKDFFFALRRGCRAV